MIGTIIAKIVVTAFLISGPLGIILFLLNKIFDLDSDILIWCQFISFVTFVLSVALIACGGIAFLVCKLWGLSFPFVLF